MPKTTEEIKAMYVAQNAKLKKGTDHFYDLMINGVTLKDPISGEEVKINNRTDHNNFFQSLHKRDNGYPMEEIGRDDCARYHMYLFLYSKGYQPSELAELISNPESEKSKEIGERIKNDRQEYYDIAISKDPEKVADMYAKAYNNLKNHDLNWLKGANSGEKLINALPQLEVLSGGQSTWLQTNRLGTTPRPIDMQIVEKIRDKTVENGTDLNAVTASMQYTNYVKQSVERAFESIEMGSSKQGIALVAVSTDLIPEGATLTTLDADKNMSMEVTLTVTRGADQAAFDYEDGGDEYYQGFEGIVKGEEGAFIPWTIFEMGSDSPVTGQKQQKSAGRWGSDSARADEHPQEWKKAMEEDFKNGDLMDGFSVLHSYNLAKKGELDEVSGIAGDGERMLEAMGGDMTKWDQLSDLAKGAVAGKLTLEHPALFNGTAENMLKEAERLGIGPDHPAYMHALNGFSKQADPRTAAKIDTVKEMMAERKLEKGLEDAPVADKKELAKNLFLMQLAGAQDKDVLKQGQDVSMMRQLACGEITIKLPKMDEPQMEALKGILPEGKHGIAGGISNMTAYQGTDLKLSTDVISRKKNAVEADLRAMSPENLKATLEALGQKLDEMEPAQLDDTIKMLGGKNLSKEELSGFVKGLGKDANGIENEHSPRMGLAAKEVNPPLELSQDDFMLIDKIYSAPIEGDRKYTLPGEVPMDKFNERLAKEEFAGAKDFFSDYRSAYKEQARQMEMYGDTAEKMHRILEQNEKSENPSANIRTFAQEKEKEMAEKYRGAKLKCDAMAAGIKEYAKEKESEISAYLKYGIVNKEMYDAVKNKNKYEGPKKDELDTNMAHNFTGVEFEKAADDTLEKMAGHKWKFMGIKFSNSDRYQSIVDSMQTLKDMRQKDMNYENVKEYKQEYEHLRDLCEDYIVTHKHPLRQDGKDRLNMIKDVWEGMSNVQGKDFDRVMDYIKPGQKIGNVNFHSGERKKVSLKELEAKEPERKARLKAEEDKRKAAAKQRRDAEKNNRGAKDVMENNKAVAPKGRR